MGCGVWGLDWVIWHDMAWFEMGLRLVYITSSILPCFGENFPLLFSRSYPPVSVAEFGF